ncbi:MAG: hypothetical protein ACI91R_002285 [Vicingaceae bacterium]
MSNIGANTVTLTVTDVNGNVSTGTTATVTVVNSVIPQITCVGNTTIDQDGAASTHTVQSTEFDATFTNNLGNGSITNDLNGLATIVGVVLQRGSTAVEWTVVYGNGQTANCTTVITVENIIPVITDYSGGFRLLEWIDDEAAIYAVIPPNVAVHPNPSKGILNAAVHPNPSKGILNVAVHPNPSKGMFNLTFQNIDTHTNIFLFDYSGRLIEQKSIASGRASQDILIGNNTLSSGVYMIKIISGDKTIIKKVMVE